MQVAVNAITEHAGMRMRAPTALMMAVASNMTDVVSELLSLGVDANVPITTCGFSAVRIIDASLAYVHAHGTGCIDA